MFDGFVRPWGAAVTTEEPEPVDFSYDMKDASMGTASWTPRSAGDFAIHLRVFSVDGPMEICGSPFLVQVVDRKTSLSSVMAPPK